MSKSCSFPKTALSRSVMLASVVVSGTLIAPNLASAQSGPAALEEVVVTATKRSTIGEHLDGAGALLQKS